MRNCLSILCCALCALVACQPNTDGNKTLEYDSLQVNFSASLADQQWPAGSRIGVLATCTRDGVESTSMSENSIANYQVASPSASSILTASTEDDKAISFKEDHNFKFVAVYPCPSSGADVSSIPVSVPAAQRYSDGIMNALTFVSSKTSVTVIPTINFDMKTMFGVLDFFVPSDLVDGEDLILKTLEVSPADPSKFSGALVQSGKYDAFKGTFTPDASKNGNLVSVDFGAGGLALKDAYTKVSVAVAPFTVPEGGLSLVFTDTGGKQTKVTAFASEKEVGQTLKAGGSMSTYVSGISDGIVPVTFPVVFPCGYPDGDGTKTGYNNSANSWLQEWWNDPACNANTKTSELWSGRHGVVHCMDQDQATISWNWGSAIHDLGFKYFIEVVNSAANLISTFGVKGVWEGDFFEFTIPVRKFAAGSKLKLSMPLYTRGGPTFWEVIYKDGEDWKSTAVDNLPAFEGSSVTMKATWAFQHGGAANAANTFDTEKTVTMEFANAVPSGNILIRVKCLNGSITNAAGNTAISEVKAPSAVPFYFWNPGKRDSQAIKIELL